MTIPAYRVQWLPGAGPYDVAGVTWLTLPGVASASASTPDHASLDVTGDLFVAVETDGTIPTPPVGVSYEVIGKQQPTGNQRSFVMYLSSDQKLRVRWSPDGLNELNRTSSEPLPRPVSGTLAFGFWLDIDNAGNNTVTFYSAPTLAELVATLPVLGTPQTAAGTTSVFASTALLSAGDVIGSGFTPYPGRLLRAQMRSGTPAGTIVANPDFTNQTPGATAFVDSAGRPWTVNGTASIGGFDWVDIPCGHVKSLSWTTGRDNELDQFRSGTATIVFRNNDRLYDPEYTAGQHYGDLLPRAPFRIQLSLDELSWSDQFYGFVKSGWKQAYQKPYASTCTVDLEDMLGVLESDELPGSAYEAEMMLNNPGAFWRLDERAGAQMFDSSGNGRHGFIDNGTLGQESLVFGGGGSFLAPHVGDNRGRFKGEGLPVGPPCTLIAWIKTPRDLAALKGIIIAQRDSTLRSGLMFDIEESAFGSPNGELVVEFFNLGGNYKARGNTRIDDDEIHMVACTIAGLTAAEVLLYVDGAAETKTLVFGSVPGAWSSHLIWTVANSINAKSGDFGLDGLIDEVSVHSDVLTADKIATLYEAGSTAFGGETSGARIERVLDLIGIPVAMRDIAAGDTTVGPAVYGSQAAASYLQGVVESEQGVFYVDHRNGGVLTFRGRYDRLTATRSTTSQASFDPCDFREDIEPEPGGIDTIVNVAEVTWQGGTEIVVDDTSRDRYGAQRRSLTTEAPTPSVAQSAGGWLISRYKDPQVRLRRLPFDLAGKPDLWATILDLRISDRTTVTRHPQLVGVPIVNSLTIEGTDMSLNEDGSWTVDYRLSNADDSQVWIWGTSTWGETTVWG